MKALEAHDLYRFYHVEEEEILALKGVSIHVDVGEVVAVQGPSGSGKSTLLWCLAGMDEPDGGYVVLSGNRMTRKSEPARAALRARLIGIMLQSGNLFDHLSVESNILLQMQLAGKKASRHPLNLLLEMVGLSSVRHSFPSQISGGETARAGLAVAISAQPAVLLADEPTGEVDAETEQMILKLLDDYRRGGGSVLVVTHSDAVASYADRVIRLFDGKVVTDD